MAQINKSSIYCMVAVVEATALADAGTLDLQLPDDAKDDFITQAISSAGVSYGPGATTFTTVYNSTTKKITFTNASGAAFTGKYIAMFVK